jgi:hypothetical protein
MIKMHASIPEALKHPTTWAGFAGVLTPVASALEGVMQHIVWGAVGACGMVGVLLKSPNTPEPPDTEPKP